jgi:hypothetical protein
MATDLFGQYFNNPSKSYVYADMTCNGPSADEISFNLSDTTGVISDNEKVLSSIDLSELHVGLTQYTNDMKTIAPYGVVYVKGIDQGESYTTKAYGVVTRKSFEIEDWEYKTTLIFHIKYVNELGMKMLKCIVGGGSIDEERTFIEATQEVLDDAKIPVNVKYEEGYLYLTSTTIGFDFWVSHCELIHYTGEGNIEEDLPEVFGCGVDEDHNGNDLGFGMDDAWTTGNANYYSNPTGDTTNAYRTTLSEEDYREIYDLIGKRFYIDGSTNYDTIVDVSTNVLCNVYLFEDLTKYVPAIRYRNGAMKGCLVFATYPKFNDGNIYETQRSLKIGHLTDRLEDFYTSPQNAYTGLPMYARVVRDVVDSYYSQYEYDIYKKWSNEYSYINQNDGWIDPNEIPVVPFDEHDANDWTHSHVPNSYVLNTIYKDEAIYDAVGIYGYATYLSKKNLWTSMGQIYLRTAVDDDEAMNVKNLIPSFIIYNPNPFPVSVKYMTFV